MPKVQIRDLTKNYLRQEERTFRTFWFPGVAALDGVSLAIEQNEFVSVLGPSGCGKTTVLRIAAGLMPATSGEVRIDGLAITSPRAKTGMVFQNVGLLPWKTARENVLFGLQLQRHRKPTAAEMERGDYCLELVGLSEFRDARPRELSGGMQQRVGIARALATEPDVLLMDEPFGALDAQTRLLLHDELLRLCDSLRVSVMFVTHDIDEAIYLSDKVAIMSRRSGRIMDQRVVPLPKPRYDYDARRAAEFADLRSAIWGELRRQLQGDETNVQR